MFPNSSAAYKSLTAFKPQNAQDVLTKANNQYDIPGYTTRLSNLRGLVGNLTSSAEAVDPSVTGRTTGSFVTSGQRDALVNKERAPILSDLSKQEGAVSQQEAGLNTASGLASQMATALMSQDQTTYQRLLDQYNAATARDTATENKRQFNATLDEQKRQANLTARTAAGGGSDIGSILGSILGGGATTSKSPKLSHTEQLGVNDVQDQIKRYGRNTDGIVNDYIATAKSASFGNLVDKAKLQAYALALPELFGKKGSALATVKAKLPTWGVSQPKPSTAQKASSSINQSLVDKFGLGKFL